VCEALDKFLTGKPAYKCLDKADLAPLVVLVRAAARQGDDRLLLSAATVVNAVLVRVGFTESKASSKEHNQVKREALAKAAFASAGGLDAAVEVLACMHGGTNPLVADAWVRLLVTVVGSHQDTTHHTVLQHLLIALQPLHGLLWLWSRSSYPRLRVAACALLRAVFLECSAAAAADMQACGIAWGGLVTHLRLALEPAANDVPFGKPTDAEAAALLAVWERAAAVARELAAVTLGDAALSAPGSSGAALQPWWVADGELLAPSQARVAAPDGNGFVPPASPLVHPLCREASREMVALLCARNPAAQAVVMRVLPPAVALVLAPAVAPAAHPSWPVAADAVAGLTHLAACHKASATALPGRDRVAVDTAVFVAPHARSAPAVDIAAPAPKGGVGLATTSADLLPVPASPAVLPTLWRDDSDIPVGVGPAGALWWDVSLTCYGVRTRAERQAQSDKVKVAWFRVQPAKSNVSHGLDDATAAALAVAPEDGGSGSMAGGGEDTGVSGLPPVVAIVEHDDAAGAGEGASSPPPAPAALPLPATATSLATTSSKAVRGGAGSVSGKLASTGPPSAAAVAFTLQGSDAEVAWPMVFHCLTSLPLSHPLCVWTRPMLCDLRQGLWAACTAWEDRCRAAKRDAQDRGAVAAASGAASSIVGARKRALLPGGGTADMEAPAVGTSGGSGGGRMTAAAAAAASESASRLLVSSVWYGSDAFDNPGDKLAWVPDTRGVVVDLIRNPRALLALPTPTVPWLPSHFHLPLPHHDALLTVGGVYVSRLLQFLHPAAAWWADTPPLTVPLQAAPLPAAGAIPAPMLQLPTALPSRLIAAAQVEPNPRRKHALLVCVRLLAHWSLAHPYDPDWQSAPNWMGALSALACGTADAASWRASVPLLPASLPLSAWVDGPAAVALLRIVAAATAGCADGPVGPLLTGSDAAWQSASASGLSRRATAVAPPVAPSGAGAVGSNPFAPTAATSGNPFATATSTASSSSGGGGGGNNPFASADTSLVVGAASGGNPFSPAVAEVPPAAPGGSVTAHAHGRAVRGDRDVAVVGEARHWQRLWRQEAVLTLRLMLAVPTVAQFVVAAGQSGDVDPLAVLLGLTIMPPATPQEAIGGKPAPRRHEPCRHASRGEGGRWCLDVGVLLHGSGDEVQGELLTDPDRQLILDQQPWPRAVVARAAVEGLMAGCGAWPAMASCMAREDLWQAATLSLLQSPRHPAVVDRVLEWLASVTPQLTPYLPAAHLHGFLAGLLLTAQPGSASGGGLVDPVAVAPPGSDSPFAPQSGGTQGGLTAPACALLHALHHAAGDAAQYQLHTAASLPASAALGQWSSLAPPSSVLAWAWETRNTATATTGGSDAVSTASGLGLLLPTSMVKLLRQRGPEGFARVFNAANHASAAALWSSRLTATLHAALRRQLKPLYTWLQGGDTGAWCRELPGGVPTLGHRAVQLTATSLGLPTTVSMTVACSGAALLAVPPLAAVPALARVSYPQLEDEPRVGGIYLRVFNSGAETPADITAFTRDLQRVLHVEVACLAAAHAKLVGLWRTGDQAARKPVHSAPGPTLPPAVLFTRWVKCSTQWRLLPPLPTTHHCPPPIRAGRTGDTTAACCWYYRHCVACWWTAREHGWTSARYRLSPRCSSCRSGGTPQLPSGVWAAVGCRSRSSVTAKTPTVTTPPCRCSWETPPRCPSVWTPWLTNTPTRAPSHPPCPCCYHRTQCTRAGRRWQGVRRQTPLLPLPHQMHLPPAPRQKPN